MIIPAAEKLRFRHDQTRMRREHAKYLALIAASALLHQHQRLPELVALTTETRLFVSGSGRSAGKSSLVDATLSFVAIDALIELGPNSSHVERILSGLRNSLDDNDYNVRGWAAFALRFFGDQAAGCVETLPNVPTHVL